MGILDWLATWAADVIEAFGYAGVFFLIVAENVFPPIPSEAILPLAGFRSSQGSLWLPGVIVAATLGAVAGALILYYVGVWFGDERLRVLIRRYGKWFAVSEADLDKANGWFDRHGGLAVLICRLVPIVRSLVSIPAGLRRMNLGAFILYTTIGSGIWNTILVVAGYILGENWEEVGHVVDYLEYPLIIAMIGAVLWFVYKRKFAKPPASVSPRTD